MTIFANVKNSLFGAPNEMPSNGMKKVKNEIDTRCFMFRLTFLTLLDILFTINAESRIMTMNNDTLDHTKLQLEQEKQVIEQEKQERDRQIAELMEKLKASEMERRDMERKLPSEKSKYRL